ncbi:MAG: phosphoglucomutase [Clostridiales bacterium]|nr:MAG: phosphoglucomutase [Clostridiales bacterium]
MNRNYEYWLSYEGLDEDTRRELESISGDEAEIEARFALPMRFGTAGLRSVMGAGISRMNVYTVGQTTQALANLINATEGSRSVAISYDSRNNSALFAKTAAEVLAGNGIHVYIYGSLHPTPCLSFAVLELGCTAGINITASHNPKEYNGYKVYWSDGAQLPPEHADTVSREAEKTDIFRDVKKADFDRARDGGLITVIGDDIDEKFMSAVLDCRIDREVTASYGNSVGIVYTPLHGTGYRLVPEVLKRAGITNLRVVESQSRPDGNFPTVAVPNPENKDCFAEAIDLVLRDGKDCDLIIATDPDADRVGAVVKDSNGLFTPLNGNQIGALLVDYIIKARKSKGCLPQNACAVKSVVSSELFTEICRKNGVEPVNVLTGFKYIGEKIAEYERTKEHSFIFGYEESCGFLSAGYVRDKDAVAGSLLIAEMASYYKSRGMTVYAALNALYDEYGRYGEKVLSIKVGGVDPMAEMNARMDELRTNLFAVIASSAVTKVRDYLSGTVIDANTGDTSDTGLPKTDMLYFELEDGTNVIVRPSGTEPKIKVYILAKGSDESSLSAKLEEYSSFMKAFFD